MGSGTHCSGLSFNYHVYMGDRRTSALAIGIIGEYIGKIYLETKARPKFIIETNLEETDKE